MCVQDASFVSWPRDDLVQTSVNGLYPLANNTRVMLGVVWPSNHSAFPDFLDPSGKTTQWWVNEFILFHKQVIFYSCTLQIFALKNYLQFFIKFIYLKNVAQVYKFDSSQFCAVFHKHNFYVNLFLFSNFANFKSFAKHCTKLSIFAH